jgi:hypothetical protein
LPAQVKQSALFFDLVHTCALERGSHNMNNLQSLQELLDLVERWTLQLQIASMGCLPQ